MKRIGFILKVKQDKIEEYKRHHEQVWPEMLDALRRPAGTTTRSSWRKTACSLATSRLLST